MDFEVEEEAGIGEAIEEAIEGAIEATTEGIGGVVAAVVGAVGEADGMVRRVVEAEVNGVAEVIETIGAGEAVPGVHLGAVAVVAAETIRAAVGGKLRLLPGSRVLLPERNLLPHLLLLHLRPVAPGSGNPPISWRWPEEATEAAARLKEFLLRPPMGARPINGTEGEVTAADHREGGEPLHPRPGLIIP